MSSKLTEAISGETVKIIEEKKDWLFIEQSDGYKSWIKEFYGTINKSFFQNIFLLSYHLFHLEQD